MLIWGVFWDLVKCSAFGSDPDFAQTAPSHRRGGLMSVDRGSDVTPLKPVPQAELEHLRAGYTGDNAPPGNLAW